MNKEFINLSNEELCAIATRLKFQMLEARFKMSTGEIEKLNVIADIRKTIAKILTELSARGFKVTIGSHGVALYNLKDNNKVQSISSDQLEKLIAKQEAKDTAKKPKATKEAKTEEAKEIKSEPKAAPKGVLKETKKEIIKEEVK